MFRGLGFRGFEVSDSYLTRGTMRVTILSGLRLSGFRRFRLHVLS